MKKKYSIFETELIVWPDDVDMNQHVHNAKYFDYVLYARYDQMERCYKVPMEEFLKSGYSWVTKSCWIEFKRPLFLGDKIIVKTGIAEIDKSDVKVHFEIIRNKTKKTAASGYFHYTMVDIKTGRAAKIPDWMIEKYSL